MVEAITSKCPDNIALACSKLELNDEQAQQFIDWEYKQRSWFGRLFKPMSLDRARIALWKTVNNIR